jgi:uncharacterized membrane protein
MLKNIMSVLQSKRSLHPIYFLSNKEKKIIVATIRAAEMKTSGEIRVHLQSVAKPDILAHGKEVFEKLGMAKTDQRNGVLIFVATRDKRFSVLADSGIHREIEQEFWNELAKKMEDHFRQNRFADGIVEAVAAIGEHLAKHFPREQNDVNELSDAISYAY